MSEMSAQGDPAMPGQQLKDTARRLKKHVAAQVRQIPCLHAVVSSLSCCRRGSTYQTLDQDDENGDGSEVDDKRQDANLNFGQIMVKGAMLGMIGITVMAMMTNSKYNPAKVLPSAPLEELEDYEFRRDAPVVLYLAAVELLICGACAHTAHAMYKRRRHCMTHPKNVTGRERELFMQVHLEKEPGRHDQQLYGLGFRPSSDGLESLLVEAVQEGSPLDLWNRQARANPTPAELVEEALGDDSPPAPRRPLKQVQLGSAIVAVNDVSGDVGMMQAELLKPQVTLWVCSALYHPSQLDTEVLPAQAEGTGVFTGPESVDNPAATQIGRPQGDAAGQPPGPRIACVALEDEEPQILVRWLVCSTIFGWVTLLPALLMQPHEERPRQQLFRQHLLKPCIIILPLWCTMWLLDCLQIILEVRLIHPFYYFVGVHMLMAAGIVWYLLQMQAADEKIVLDQRQARQSEAAPKQPLVVEDPSPTLLKEFITMNPVALVWLGSCVSIPIVLFSLLTPMATPRSRMAQGYLNIVYAPCIFFQVGFMYLLYHVRFMDLPKLYLAGFGLLLSIPCFLIWCLCLVCASRYGRQDMALVQQQRLERAKAAGQKMNWTVANPNSVASMIDCSEALHREWEFIYTA